MALGAFADSNIPPEIKVKMVEPLITALKNENWLIRSAARDALKELVGSNISSEQKTKIQKALDEFKEE